LTTDVLARLVVWPRVWLARRGVFFQLDFLQLDEAKRMTTEMTAVMEPAAEANNDEKRAATASIKQLRAQDAASAMREYQQERLQVLARTEQLRALRLSRERGASQDGEQRAAKSSR
jgi:hypothetical protein